MKVFKNMNEFMEYFLPKTLKEEKEILRKIRESGSPWKEVKKERRSE